MNFYIIEYSYKTYSDDSDEYYLGYSIHGALVQGGTEVEGFDRVNLHNPEKMDELISLVINKYFNVNETIQDFLNE